MKKLQEMKTKFLWIQFLQIHKNVLGMCFCAYLGMVDIEFISDYSFQLALDICLHACMEKYVSVTCSLSTMWLAFVIVDFSQETLLNHQRTSCLMLQIKLTIG